MVAFPRVGTNLALCLVALGCGKLPDSSPSHSAGSASGSGGGAQTDTGARPSSIGGAAADPFACVSNAQTGDMVSVPEAAFSMGCNTQVDSNCEDDEKPLHVVTLGAFEIDRTEVTQDEYTACVEAHSCSAPSCEWDCTATELPAACIAWAQAKAYCAWAGKRLPTEAEWEKAARGTDGRKYPWGNDAADCARVNMSGCGDHPEDVGSHPSGASPYGALDMAGNVVEMVADWYAAAYYATSPATDPKGPTSGSRYVGRGGGYRSEAVWQRASVRDWYDLSDASKPLGFRCAR